MITYQIKFGRKPIAYQFKNVSELLKQLPYKRYDEISPMLGRGIVLRMGDDKDFVVIPYKSRDRVVRLLNNLYCKQASL